MKKISLLLLFIAIAGYGEVFAQENTAVQNDQAEVVNITPDSLAAVDTLQNFVTVTTLKGAYFNSSCGEDRLGGSKMGFVDKDIVLKAESATEDLYKILLSDNRYAYMPKEMVADTTVEAGALNVVASGSMNISNSGATDRIKIGLPGRKPYIIRENSNPHQLVVELFGVQNNSNWVTQYLNLETVENIELIQSDSEVLTLVVNLKGKSSWGYSAQYDNNTLIIDLKHAPEFSLKGLTVGIDAGHGGPSSTGAVGRTTQAKEKELNLAMSFMLKDILESKGAKVVMSRTSDVGLTMTERKEIFLANNIDMLISIHCNAGGGTAHGTSTYYKHIQNRELAKQIADRLVEIKGVDLFGLVGNFNFSLNAPTEYPTVLVETLFLSYQPDEEKLIDPKFQKEMMKKASA